MQTRDDVERQKVDWRVRQEQRKKKNVRREKKRKKKKS